MRLEILAPLLMRCNRSPFFPSLVKLAEVLNRMFRLNGCLQRAQSEPVSKRVLSALNPACGASSRNQRCIRSIAFCLYPNFASMLQRATIMVNRVESYGRCRDRTPRNALRLPADARALGLRSVDLINSDGGATLNTGLECFLDLKRRNAAHGFRVLAGLPHAEASAASSWRNARLSKPGKRRIMGPCSLARRSVAGPLPGSSENVTSRANMMSPNGMMAGQLDAGSALSALPLRETRSSPSASLSSPPFRNRAARRRCLSARGRDGRTIGSRAEG